MIVLRFYNLKNINTSLQVGDAIYAKSTTNLLNDNSKDGGTIDANKLVGILRKIDNTVDDICDLYVDDTNHNGVASANDFIMFSKYNESNGDIKGYYAEVKFVNNSTDKAELCQMVRLCPTLSTQNFMVRKQ